MSYLRGRSHQSGNIYCDCLQRGTSNHVRRFKRTWVLMNLKVVLFPTCFGKSAASSSATASGSRSRRGLPNNRPLSPRKMPVHASARPKFLLVAWLVSIENKRGRLPGLRRSRALFTVQRVYDEHAGLETHSASARCRENPILQSSQSPPVRVVSSA